MSSNLPPGVTEGMIPGNRPEDRELEALWQKLEALVDAIVETWEAIGDNAQLAPLLAALERARDLGEEAAREAHELDKRTPADLQADAMMIAARKGGRKW